ncbi:unnamed protein product [Cylicocyclus nassatus]|uniref:7TM GPCR serpentine receptor class x (Srx) domain-containing protein n=1 Tax=Cylicocyclus nassatus TaxID=53992 RepID=A0AA36H369_CYLNA|nr:unnamed protein product [Cylicocyclus nassatus]
MTNKWCKDQNGINLVKEEHSILCTGLYSRYHAIHNYHFLCLISRFATTRLQVFVTTTLTWELLHSTNGFIIILFNKPLREKFFKMRRLKSFAPSIKKVQASTVTT